LPLFCDSDLKTGRGACSVVEYGAPKGFGVIFFLNQTERL